MLVNKFTGRLTWKELKIFHALLLPRRHESADAMLPPVLLTGKYIISPAKKETLLDISHPQDCQDVDEFVSYWEKYLEKCSITSLAHKWILCSEWVPSE